VCGAVCGAESSAGVVCGRAPCAPNDCDRHDAGTPRGNGTSPQALLHALGLGLGPARARTRVYVNTSMLYTTRQSAVLWEQIADRIETVRLSVEKKKPQKNPRDRPRRSARRGPTATCATRYSCLVSQKLYSSHTTHDSIRQHTTHILLDSCIKYSTVSESVGFLNRIGECRITVPG